MPTRPKLTDRLSIEKVFVAELLAQNNRIKETFTNNKQLNVNSFRVSSSESDKLLK